MNAAFWFFLGLGIGVGWAVPLEKKDTATRYQFICVSIMESVGAWFLLDTAFNGLLYFAHHFLGWF